MLELTKLWSHDPMYNIIWVIMTSNLFFKTFILKRLRVANFADIIWILAMFIKTTFKDLKNVKRIINCVWKCNLYLYCRFSYAAIRTYYEDKIRRKRLCLLTFSSGKWTMTANCLASSVNFDTFSKWQWNGSALLRQAVIISL